MKIDSKKIEQAQKALKSSKIVDAEGQYDKEFKGYISSFGASVAHAGLLPTIIFFEAESEQAKERKKVITALVKMLKIDDSKPLSKSILEGTIANDKTLLCTVTESMVALKLALRLYKEKKEKKTDND